MSATRHTIIGCGDVGRRVATQLINSGIKPLSISTVVQSSASAKKCLDLGLITKSTNLDADFVLDDNVHLSNCYYLVPPQKTGATDQRSATLIKALEANKLKPNKVVLISTTGVYGDCQGEWVTEESATIPETDRGKRRLSAERVWSQWSESNDVPLVILRVPGIYANSRIPRARLEAATPVVCSQECGFTNRIHADDLAGVMISAMQGECANELYNVTDGSPGTISEYLQAAAKQLGLPPLVEISMNQAREELSIGMLSYLNESRKISNKKLLDQLNVTLRYPDFMEGLKFG